MSTVVAVQGELTVFTVHALKDRLLNALMPGETLMLNLDEVTEFDGAGLQLLLAAQREARQRATAMCLQSPPPPLLAALELTGLRTEFDILPHDQEALQP